MLDIQVTPALEPLRSGPRYTVILRKMGFVPGVKPEPPPAN